MIVPMKRLTLVALKADEEAILQALQRNGTVEVISQADVSDDKTGDEQLLSQVQRDVYKRQLSRSMAERMASIFTAASARSMRRTSTRGERCCWRSVLARRLQCAPCSGKTLMCCAISAAWNGWWPYAEAPAYARCAARLPAAVRMYCGNTRAPHDHACAGGFRTFAASGKDPDACGNACAGTFAFPHACAHAADGDDWLSGRHPHHADAGAKREAGGWNV